MSDTFDVAIVGYGPVGAMTALQLADAGHSVAIVERRTGILDIPRAVGIDSESMRSFQRLGLGAEIERVVQPPREKDEFCFTNSKLERYFGLEPPAFGPNGYREIAFFDQPQLEEELRAQVEASPRITVREGVDVRAIEQDATRVWLDGEGPDGPVRVEARYLVGCDGASSFVRDAIGARWESLGYDQDWLVVDITLGPDAELPTTTMQVCDPERLATYVPCRDPYRRWEFQVVDGDVREEMVETATIQRLIAPWLAPEHYTVRRAVVYQFHAAVASEWRRGRVLLAGDAAHQTPPFLGQGLNSGFRDAVNLGWKLPLVLAGTCDDALLDTYWVERGEHSRDLVDRAVGIGQLMETLAAREAGRPDPYADAASRAALPENQLIPPLRGGAFDESQVDRGEAAGRALYQPTVRDAAGAELRLDATLGSGFAVVGRSEKDLQVGPEAARVLEALGATRVVLEGLEEREGSFDPLFETHAAALVRPDRLVYGVVDEAHDLDALVLGLARHVSLRSH